mmetsp:Transcript_21679/g.54746  ORF Transcript_21679/g.54746 Transcript_21679/m.54746 type:complete len:302 (-) Transcript_21679:525-1430(-)
MAEGKSGPSAKKGQWKDRKERRKSRFLSLGRTKSKGHLEQDFCSLPLPLVFYSCSRGLLAFARFCFVLAGFRAFRFGGAGLPSSPPATLCRLGLGLLFGRLGCLFRLMLQKHGRCPDLLLTVEVAVRLGNFSRGEPHHFLGAVPRQQLQCRLGVGLRLPLHPPREHQQRRHIRMPVHRCAVKGVPVPPCVCVRVRLGVEQRRDSLGIPPRRCNVQRRPLVLLNLQAGQGPRTHQHPNHVVPPLAACEVHAARAVLGLGVDVGARPDELLRHLPEAQSNSIVQRGPTPGVHIDELRPSPLRP